MFISSNSVDRRGYVQREIKIALNKLEEKLVDDVYIIPVALDEGIQRPPELKKIQFVSAASADCLEEIRLSISDQLAKIGDVEARETQIEKVKYHRRQYSDSYDGVPGYEINADFLNFSSDVYPNLKNATDSIAGAISRSIMESRACAISPDNSLYNIGQSRWSRTNTLDWVLSDVAVSGRTLSVVYTVHHYGAGAAHPVSRFQSFNFFLSPLIEIINFESMIEDKSCLELIQTAARAQLTDTLRSISGSEPDKDWIVSGTQDWTCFRQFSIKDSNVVFHFGSYQVAAYVFGHQTVTIAAKDLAPHMTEFAANSLDLGWVRRKAKEARNPPHLTQGTTSFPSGTPSSP
jgi:hypothetical protein